MDIFSQYVSNTLAANGNQTVFDLSGNSAEGLVFSKVYLGGTFDYIFAFSDSIDSTFGDGSRSVCNERVPAWTVENLSVAVTSGVSAQDADFYPVTLAGSPSFSVNSPLIFTDPIRLSAEKDSYVCMKIRFSGTKIPCHEESVIPVFRRQGDGYVPDKKVPLPVFTGVKRKVTQRVAFIGDSITQGCGTPVNGYQWYSAYLAEMLPDDFAFWNMGLGYARGSDAATDRVWLYKAKQNDTVSVCFGVNDILQGHSAKEVCRDIETIVTSLKRSGVKVLLQTVPPFDYTTDKEKIWREVNAFIRTGMKDAADLVFDTVPVLSKDGTDSPAAGYGTHPNAEGHRLWAEKLAPALLSLIEEENR